MTSVSSTVMLVTFTVLLSVAFLEQKSSLEHHMLVLNALLVSSSVRIRSEGGDY